MSGEPNAMNRVKVGFFSFTQSSPTGDDRPYLSWHQLDHMPEQYRLPGLVLGQRWRSSAACRRARGAEADGWSAVEHVVCYLMGDPVDQTVDDFLALGRELAAAGRYSQVMPSRYRGALRLLGTCAAPRALVSPEVVPFRPYRGVYMVVEEPDAADADADADDDADDDADADAGWDEHLRHMGAEIPSGLVEVEGVAGVWTYATAPDLRRRMFTKGRIGLTVCYLDDDPVAVADRLAPTVNRLWSAAPTRMLLAAPFESIIKWDWD